VIPREGVESETGEPHEFAFEGVIPREGVESIQMSFAGWGVAL
jgi:hypothetical protein